MVTKAVCTGLELTGRPKIDGVLGVIGGTSNLINGGGVLFTKLEDEIPLIRLFVPAA